MGEEEQAARLSVDGYGTSDLREPGITAAIDSQVTSRKIWRAISSRK